MGRFAERHPWSLNVNTEGEAKLVINTFPQETRREFNVSKEQLAELRNALIKERFFELAQEYGDHVPDSSTNTITMTVGDQTKIVNLLYLPHSSYSDPKKMRDPARAARVLLLIRDWFDDKEAVDLRRYLRTVIDAAPAER